MARAIAHLFFLSDLNLSSSSVQTKTKQRQGYREDAGLFLESDTDEQLLINIPFTQGRRESERRKRRGRSGEKKNSTPTAFSRSPSKNLEQQQQQKTPPPAPPPPPLLFLSGQDHLHLDQGPRRRHGPSESPHLRQQALHRLLRGRVRPSRGRVRAECGCGRGGDAAAAEGRQVHFREFRRDLLRGQLRRRRGDARECDRPEGQRRGDV